MLTARRWAFSQWAETGQQRAAEEQEAVFPVSQEPWAQPEHGLNQGLEADLTRVPSNQES